VGLSAYEKGLIRLGDVEGVLEWFIHKFGRTIASSQCDNQAALATNLLHSKLGDFAKVHRISFVEIESSNSIVTAYRYRTVRTTGVDFVKTSTRGSR